MLNETVSNKGNAGLPMVFACSGASNLGCMADRAARALANEETAEMCCTAAVASSTAWIPATETAEAALSNLH